MTKRILEHYIEHTIYEIENILHQLELIIRNSEIFKTVSNIEYVKETIKDFKFDISKLEHIRNHIINSV